MSSSTMPGLLTADLAAPKRSLGGADDNPRLRALRPRAEGALEEAYRQIAPRTEIAVTKAANLPRSRRVGRSTSGRKSRCDTHDLYLRAQPTFEWQTPRT